MAEIEAMGGGPDGPPPAIELRHINKTFGTVRANQDISLRIEPGTIHGIVGENGAGKSTLMNILYGLHRADTGEMLINGAPATIHSTADAIHHGIGMVHQHFMLVPNFSVLENVMMGSEGGMVLEKGRQQMLSILERFATDYGMTVDPQVMVGELPVGLQQRVEIIKALKGGAKILILDEPTGVLTPQEAESLFKILNLLKDSGVTILLITHKLEEIMAVTDNVSIMRNGKIAGHRKTAQTSPEDLAELMVGRKVLLQVDKGISTPGDVCLDVAGLGCKSANGARLLGDITFQVRAGEILGVAGVSGNGQSELLQVLSGMRAPDEGSITVLGDRITPQETRDPNYLRSVGLAHIPEDRHKHGLVLGFEARENTILGYHNSALTGDGFFFDRKAVTDHCQALMDTYDARPVNPNLPARNFSGGNQQKLVIAREMNAAPKVLIVGQPTRGVDIGAIEFIHKQIIALRDAGCAILVVSVELEEVLGLSDRIMVMNNGHVVGIVDREGADVNRLGLMMAGIAEGEAA